MASQCSLRVLARVGLVCMYLVVTKNEGLSGLLPAYESPSNFLRVSLNFTLLAIFRAEWGKALFLSV